MGGIGTLLVILASIVGVWLLFVLDPGGAIAESGFPDFRAMDWKQLMVWCFRTIGIGVGLLIILVLWLWPKPRLLGGDDGEWGSGQIPTPQSSSMPAAALSVVESRMPSSRTVLASIIEMCERGTLGLECIRTRSGFLYRLFRRGPPQYDWERLICDNLPAGHWPAEKLYDRLKQHEGAIGDMLGENLRHQGIFDDNPVRVREEDFGDAGWWRILVGALMGAGGGLWLALWVSQWWVNALVGGLVGFVYMLIAPIIPTGMPPPTQRGSYEIGQWLGWKNSLARSNPSDARNQFDSMLAHAVALDAAQPWLDPSAPAPSWFGPGQASSLADPDLNAAYHGFMHASTWGLFGRSEDVVEAVAKVASRGESEFTEFGPPAQEQAEAMTYERPSNEGVAHDAVVVEGTPADPWSSSPDYGEYPPMEWSEKEVERGGCSGCLKWVAGLVGIGVLSLIMVVAYNMVQPAVKPCPSNSPTILTPAQIVVLMDLVVNECTSVIGEVVSQDTGLLVVDVDREEFKQLVWVLGPSEIFDRARLGGRVHVAGRIEKHEEWWYVVRYGFDRGWWGNFRENLPGDFLAP